LTDNKERYGLGYKPTKADKRRITEERVERGLSTLDFVLMKIKTFIHFLLIQS